MRKYGLVLSLKAIKDIQIAVDYYNGQSNGLGVRFYADFKHQLVALQRNPYSRAIRYDDIRFAMLDKFPYAAHYNIENNAIKILGVISTHQNPETAWISK